MPIQFQVWVDVRRGAVHRPGLAGRALVVVHKFCLGIFGPVSPVSLRSIHPRDSRAHKGGCNWFFLRQNGRKAIVQTAIRRRQGEGCGLGITQVAPEEIIAIHCNIRHRAGEADPHHAAGLAGTGVTMLRQIEDGRPKAHSGA